MKTKEILILAVVVVLFVVAPWASQSAFAGYVVIWGDVDVNEPNDPNEPYPLDSNDYVAIGSGSHHTLAIKSDGSLVGLYYSLWGNSDGQCDVPEGNDFVDVAAGWYHSLAIKDDGSVVAWGRNNNGQCNVPDGNDFVAIAAGSEHSMALTSDAVNILTMSTIPAGLDCIIPGQGEHGYYLGQGVFINAPRCPNCPDVYKFDHWTGDITEPNLTFGHLIMDKDRTITAVYVADERLCGDECHPILQGDVNEDCYINFVDFALYAQRWMSCTHPDCD